MKTEAWVRRLRLLGDRMDERARTLAVTDATREAITREDRVAWKKLAAAGPDGELDSCVAA